MRPGTEETDPAVVARVRAGERDAYAVLVRRYQTRVLGLCRSMLGQAADAEDAAQEAFLKAYQALDSFREGSSFYTWLYRIAANHCLSLLRAKSRRRTESLDAIVDEEREGLYRLFAATPDPRSAIEAGELVERILGALKPEYRLAVTLRERDGLSYEEIAEVTASSVDSVKARLRRGRDEIEKNLRHFLPAEGV